MIVLYNAQDKTYTDGGINITKFCKSARVKEMLNGSFNLEVLLTYNAILWNSISKEMQIRVPTHRNKILTFRIKDITKDSKTLKLTCRHIFWDLGNNLIEDIYIKTMGGADAINYILSNGQYETKWAGDSDIDVAKNCRIVREYQLDALMGSDDNTFKSRWGGELTIDDYFIRIDKRRGSTEPLTISFKKDVLGFEFYEDTSQLATRIMPIGFDGILLPELYVDSPLIDNYAMPYIRKYKMEDIKIITSDSEGDPDEGYASPDEAYREMRRRVTEELYAEQEVDKPKQNIRANLRTLRESDQYRKYGFDKLEGIQLGDSVDVDISEYNITTSKRCISIEYDCLLERYVEVELGEFKGYDEQDADYTTPEIDIDSKLEPYKSGMFFHRNDKALTLSTAKQQVAFLTFGTVQDSHLQFTMCLVGNATETGVATMYLELDNQLMEIKPMQTVQPGYFTWTVTIPLLFITGNVSHSLAVSFESTTNIAVSKEQLALTIYGQSISGGAGASYPHAEATEEVPNSIRSNYAGLLSDVSAVEVLENFVKCYDNNEVIPPTIVTTNKLITDEVDVEVTHLGFQSVWSWTNYETQSTRYTMDSTGVKYNNDTVYHTAKEVQLVEGEQGYIVVECDLPSTDVYYIIGEGELV